jgi:hypothetical protein
MVIVSEDDREGVAVCGSRRDISEREVLVAILAHLGLPTEAPPMARARSPAFEGA